MLRISRAFFAAALATALAAFLTGDVLAQAKKAKASGEKFSVATSPFQPTIPKRKEPSQAKDKDADPLI